MIRHLFLLVLVSLCVVFASCQTPQQPQTMAGGTNRYGYGNVAPTTTAPVQQAAPTQTPTPIPPVQTAPPEVMPTPIPTPTAQPQNYPVATKVPNKPGRVTSPYAPNAGEVDVEGYPPGAEVKDPYTGKIFLVP
jgi:hypothetical protein